ncbi:Glutathione S-transferase [Chamberlinius hualienensis]
MSPPIVYGIKTSPPVRAVLLTAKAAGVEIDFKVCNLVTSDHLNSDYTKMNPAHTIPSLNDNGFVIWESRAVMTYLVDTYAKGSAQNLYPKDVHERAKVDNILHFDNGSLWAAIRRAFFGPLLFSEPAPAGAIENFRDKLETLENILTLNQYVAGDKLTLADISIVCSLTIPEACDFGFGIYPRIKKWNAKVISELPFYEEVTAEGLKLLDEKYEMNWKKLQPKLP